MSRYLNAASGRLAEIVEAQAAVIRQKGLAAALQEQRTYLSRFSQSDAASVLIETQDPWHADHYEEATQELVRLEGLREVFNHRRALLAKLETPARARAQAIANRQKPHDGTKPPGRDPASAWRWRSWLQELNRRAAVSLPDLQERFNATQDELRRFPAKIIEHETWPARANQAYPTTGSCRFCANPPQGWQRYRQTSSGTVKTCQATFSRCATRGAGLNYASQPSV
jgi:hypothetical protein